VCPVDAIVVDRTAPPDFKPWVADNARFFAEPLPGRDAPIGNPGGALKVGEIGTDTELVGEHTPAAL
jgi:hypothetical protein